MQSISSQATETEGAHSLKGDNLKLFYVEIQTENIVLCFEMFLKLRRKLMCSTEMHNMSGFTGAS